MIHICMHLYRYNGIIVAFKSGIIVAFKSKTKDKRLMTKRPQLKSIVDQRGSMSLDE